MRQDLDELVAYRRAQRKWHSEEQQAKSLGYAHGLTPSSLAAYQEYQHAYIDYVHSQHESRN